MRWGGEDEKKEEKINYGGMEKSFSLAKIKAKKRREKLESLRTVFSGWEAFAIDKIARCAFTAGERREKAFFAVGGKAQLTNGL